MNQSRERANERTEQEERTRAKDSAAIFASSSPLFCFVCFLHRPHHRQPLTPHHVAPSPNEMAATSSASGRCYRHTSPPHRKQPAATGQRLDGLQSFPPRPRPRSLPSGGEEEKSKGANRTGRERTRAKDAADLFARSSPLLMLRLMSSPSTSSPAAHHFARLCQRSGRGTGGHLVRFWAMSSPPPRHHIASDKQPANSRAAPRRSAILPASSSSSSFPRRRPLLQVVREGHRSSQVGRFPPAHHVDPLHPAGVPSA